MGSRTKRTVQLCGATIAAMTFGFMVSVSPKTHASGNEIYGSFGPQGPRMREQLWLLPSGDPKIPLRATLFQPEAEIIAPASTGFFSPQRNAKKRPLVIINHGTDESTRESVSMPVFYWLSRWFIERGYSVVVPQRRGHGATGGELAEARDNCLAPNHVAAGEAAADDIEAVFNYMAQQEFVDRDQITVVGISSGGWGSLALAARNPPGLKGVINFAGGRGAYAGGKAGAMCSADRLIEASGKFGARARVPTLWLYSANDSYFGSELAKTMASAWSGHGGAADLHVLPAYGSEGHNLADDKAGWGLWGTLVRDFMQGEAAQQPVRPAKATQSASANGL